MASCVLVNKGLDIITNCLGNIATPTPPKYIGWGIGTTGAVVANTDLESASAEARTTGTVIVFTTTMQGDTYQVSGTITCAGAGKNITEVAIFDASTSGNMFMRATFDAVSVGVGDTITFVIKTIFAQV